MQSDYRQVKRVLWLILLANFIVALLKIVVGIAIRSTSMTADGFHSIADTTSNILGIIGIILASKPTDKELPYGHSKFEVISGLFIGAMLLFLAGKIIVDALESFRNPVVPAITIESLIALFITLFINIFVSNYEYKMGKRLNSYILISDSLHTKSDIFVSIGVLVTLLGVKFGLPIIIDPIVSLVVAGFILYASYEIFKSTINVLVDKAIIDDKDVISVLYTFKEIKTYHNIRSRGSENNIYIDMHIMVDPNMTVENAHKLSHDIEDKIRKIVNENAQVIIHIEPYYEKYID